MKKMIFFALVAMMMTACGSKKGDANVTNTDTAVQMSENTDEENNEDMIQVEMEYRPLDDIEAAWASKTIYNVPSGSLDKMLERFNQTWTTGVADDACGVMREGVERKVLDEETGYTVVNDTKNGYVSAFDDGTDSEYMSACVWKRDNGHRLFSVVLGQPTDPEIEFICFYDYDPEKKTLKPEPAILNAFPQKDELTHRSFVLPKSGKNLMVTDITNDNEIYEHLFTWDGMKPVFSKTEEKDWDSYFGL